MGLHFIVFFVFILLKKISGNVEFLFLLKSFFL